MRPDEEHVLMEEDGFLVPSARVKRRASSQGGEGSLGSKRSRSGPMSKDDMLLEFVRGLNSSMSTIANCYERKVELLTMEYAEKRYVRGHKPVDNESTARKITSSSVSAQAAVQSAKSLMEVVSALDRVYVIYKNARKRSADPSHVELLRQAYEVILAVSSSLERNLEKATAALGRGQES
ncbi:hypothetical protein FGB62_77g032 [Gracilaria domingensis]|nr:hypothetical protein FGB62_77g032 [Gracilaria domingensis]